MKRSKSRPTLLILAFTALFLLAQLCQWVIARNRQPDKAIRPALITSFHVPGHQASLAFDSKGENLVTVGWRESDIPAWQAGTSRGDIRIWNLAARSEIAHFGDEAGGLFDVAISPDDKTIVTAGRVLQSPNKGEVRIWDAKTQKPIRTLPGHTHWVVSVAYSPDGKLIATGSFDRCIRIWDAATGTPVIVLDFSRMLPRSLRFGTDGKTLVAGYESGSVVLWDTKSWTKRNVFKADGLILFSADMSGDGKRVVGAGPEKQPRPGQPQGGRIHLWDIATGREEQAMQVELVSGAAFSPSGNHFVAAGSPSRIWLSATGEEVGSFEHADGTSQDKIRFSADGKRLGVGGVAAATLWDVSGLGTKQDGK
jgi:WD40 repeat protein